MASVNKAIILGNLGRDPELRHTPGGKAVATLRIATNEVWTDQSGERQERTEWHTVVVWGRQAENCSQYLKKGRSVYIEGRLTTRKWQDKEGKDRYTTEIIANNVTFVGGGRGENVAVDKSSFTGFTPPAEGASKAPLSGGVSFDDDDIPF